MSKKKKIRMERNRLIPKRMEGFVPNTPPGSEMLHSLAELRGESEETTRKALGILMGATGDPQGLDEARAAENFLERLYNQFVGTVYPLNAE